jgi:hypothetical protein
VEDLITVPKRGRKIAIGPLDGFFLFFHWLRSAAPIDTIATAFRIKTPTLYKHLHQLGRTIHPRLVERYIEAQWQAPLSSPKILSDASLIVDATVQKR